MTQMSADYHLPPPLVHIVILTWNYREVTADCLRTLQKMSYSNYSVVVVDNASTDDTVEFVGREFPGVTVIANDRNLGFAAGCNVGIRHALAEGADYVLLMNNDALAPADLLDNLVGHAESLLDAWIVAPWIIHADGSGRVWFAGARRSRLTLALVEASPHGTARGCVDNIQEVDYVLGTAMLVRRDAFEQVGLFDESYFMYYEEMDFCLRVSAAGFKLYSVQDVCVQHRVAVSTSSLPAAFSYHKARSSVIFYRKHTHGVRSLVIVPFRMGSTVRTLARHARHREWVEARAHLQGLVDGATGSLRMAGSVQM